MKPSAKPTKPTATAKAGEKREFGNHRPMMRELYRRAEAQLRKRRNDLKSQLREDSEDAKPATDTHRLLHELQVHQIELEMQNAELRQSRDELEQAVENYTDLYDFAPVAYFTLTADSTIQQANLTGASLVCIDRSRLVGRCFDQHFPAAVRPDFQAFLKKVFAGSAKQSGDFEMLCPGHPSRMVNIEARRSPAGESCRVAVVDITVRKRAEEKVRTSEVRYRRLFEAAHDGVLLLDPATRKITDANPFMTKLLGYKHDQLVGKELFEIGLLKDEAASQEMFQKLKRQREVRYEDLPLESQTGRHQEVEVVANLYQEDGHAVIQCNIRNITARKQVEQQLAEKARLLDLSHDAIIVRDMKGHIRYWNHGAEELYGWPRQEALGKVSHRLLQTEFPTPVKRMMAELLRTDRWIGELVHTTRAGRRITVLARKTLDRDRQGRPLAVLENISDITARKQAEVALSASEARFRAAVGAVSSLIWTNNAQGLMEGEQPGWASFTGQTLKEYQGYGWAKAVHPQDAPPTVAAWKRAVAKKSIFEFEHRVRRRDGEWRLCSIHAVPLLGGDGQIREWVGVHTDITERKRAEEGQRRLDVMTASNRKLEEEIIRRRAIEKSLQQSERHQRGLLAQSQVMQAQLRHLSHQILSAQEEERKKISRELHDEITQILAGINLRLGGLKAGAGAQSRSFQNQIARTQRLVEQSVEIVHRFARDLRPTLLDDLGLIPALHAFVKTFTQETGLRVSLTVFAGVEKLDSARRTVLFRVAQEALTNVHRHARASSVVLHIKKTAERRVLMTIHDNGQNPPDDPMRAGARGKRLGLIGMRERLEMVGGKFNIQGEPGQGTTVIAEVPFGKGRGGGGDAKMLNEFTGGKAE